MGDDFSYEYHAHDNFVNMDIYINLINSPDNGNVVYDDFIAIYSTPEEYLKQIKKLDIKFPTRTDDLMPYSDKYDSYWTGFYSSRPNDKSFFRSATSLMHA